MRYVSVSLLQEGMTIGKTLYTANGTVFVKEGTMLKQVYIDAIKRQNYPGIYINDAYSEDIEIQDVVDPQLRSECSVKLKEIYTTVFNSDEKTRYDSLKASESIVLDLIDEVLKNKDVAINLIDLKTHDDYTYQHSINVSILSLVIGTFLDYDTNSLKKLGLAGSLHDIGKMFVPLEILNKPGKLTPHEFDLIKQHPRFGYDFLKSRYIFPADVYVSVLQHHEKYSGDGYPGMKSKDEILHSARIIAISDVFDAITSKRSYHMPVPATEAIEYIMANSGGHFDPDVVKAFLRKVSVYPLGVTVKLSNALTGIVIQNSPDHPMRPKVRILTANPKDAYELDLWEDKKTANITILETL